MITNVTVKGLIVGGLILGLLIPTLFLAALVNDRASRKADVVKEVTAKWASAQTITGPVLVVPYLVHYLADGKPQVSRKLAYFLPEHLQIKGDMQPQIRYRSIYKVPVYESNIDLAGDFSALPLKELNIPAEDLLTSEASLCMGLGDLRGIEEPLQVTWDNKALDLNPGLPSNDVLESGLSATPGIGAADLQAPHRFSVHMRLRGSDYLYFTPLGKTTDVALSSPWNDPSFDGSFLPIEKNVTAKGFSASWKVLYLNRNFPQCWLDKKYDLQGASFGVNLFDPSDIYTQTNRCVKYAILFIGLTFSLYFFMEIFQEKNVHVMQYVLVGIALCIFYSLLLSISEYLGFTYAYGIAGLATILMIAVYTRSVFGKRSVGWLFGSVLVALYGFIYVLIRLEDGALLFGSIGLFAILALVMYYSRRVDWQRGAVVKAEQIPQI